DHSYFAIDGRFARLGIQTQTFLKFLPPDREVRDYEFHGDQGIVKLDPTWVDTVSLFSRLGVQHVLQAGRHTPVLLPPPLPFRRLRDIVVVLVGFAVGHSLTLIAASRFGLTPNVLWFLPFVSTLTAAAIFYFAIENLVAPRLPRRRGMVFGVGLVYGFALSAA